MKYKPDPIAVARWLAEPAPLTTIDSPQLAAVVMSALLTDGGEPWPEERLAVLALTRRATLVDAAVLTLGSSEHCIVDAKQVLRWALTRCRPVASIILGHNHPSGVTTPSDADAEVTRVLVNAGRVVGIGVLDHLVIGNGFYSFAENGRI